MKYTHWYLRGWEYESRMGANGQRKQALVYHGEYYHIPKLSGGATPLKAAYLASTVLLWAVLAVMLTHVSRGASLFFVGAPCGLSLIPALYLTIGVVRFLGMPTVMTYRDVRASLYRIRVSSQWTVTLMAVSLMGELFYLVYRALHGLPIAWGEESLWVVGGLLGGLLSALQLVLGRRYRAETCPPGKKP